MTADFQMPSRKEGETMKIVVIGGCGLIGSKLVPKLREARTRGCSGVTEYRCKHRHR